jgi:hypothetical protein
MSFQSTERLDNDLRVILENLAEGLFPLNVWLNGNASTPPKKYIPPQKNLPWRAAGHSLSPGDLGVIPFFETLLDESSELIAVLKRWHELRAEPLKFCPLVNPQKWRSRRFQGSLHSEFGDSGNTASFEHYFIHDESRRSETSGKWWKAGTVVGLARVNPLEHSDRLLQRGKFGEHWRENVASLAAGMIAEDQFEAIRHRWRETAAPDWRGDT